jgi:hypothetical protein
LVPVTFDDDGQQATARRVVPPDDKIADVAPSDDRRSGS